jgi:outer membrane receptor protein involved in Fe transport
VRIAVFHDHAAGWIDATGAAAGKNINQGDSTGGRVSLLLEPTARFHVRATALSQEIHRDGNDYVTYDASTGKPVTGDLKRDLTLREPYSTRVQLGSIDLENDFGWARFNSITSAQATGLDRHLDYTGIYNPLLGNAFETIPVSLVSHVQKQTQEFRLTSPGGESVEWLAGLFWTHESGVNHQQITSTMAGGTAGPLLVGAELPSTLNELAAYGDLTWKPVAGLSLTGGVRVARNRQTFSEDLSGALTAAAALDGSSSETSKTYLATASYALTPSSNVYVRAASGYRPGGPNAALTDPDTGALLAPLQFKHDSNWSYEAGYKADLLDKTLSVEAAIYDIEWKDIQQYTAVEGLSVITNGGKAQVQGAELGARWQASAALKLNGSLSYMDAHLTEAGEGLGSAGAPLPNSARLSGNAGADYSFTLGGYQAWVGGSERFVGGRHAGFAGSSTLPDFHMPAYWMTDLQAGIDLKRVQVSLYARNVMDRRAIVSAQTAYVPLGSAVQAQVAQPRTLGVTLSAGF